MALKAELEELLNRKVRKEEVKRLIERLYCHYFEEDGMKYSFKDFEDGSPQIDSLHIEINSFYIYVQFETKYAEQRGNGTWCHSEKVCSFCSALNRITKGRINDEDTKIYRKKGDTYMVQIYFSNRYEIEVLE